MLLGWTGREIRDRKCGAIPDNLAPILDRLGLDQSNWVKTVREFGRMFNQAAGRASSLARAAPVARDGGFRERRPLKPLLCKRAD
jgi:putative transposase